jgi:hypothetical protein
MEVPSMFQGESLTRLMQGALAGAIARSLSVLTGAAGRSAPLTRWRTISQS